MTRALVTYESLDPKALPEDFMVELRNEDSGRLSVEMYVAYAPFQITEAMLSLEPQELDRKCRDRHVSEKDLATKDLSNCYVGDGTTWARIGALDDTEVRTFRFVVYKKGRRSFHIWRAERKGPFWTARDTETFLQQIGLR